MPNQISSFQAVIDVISGLNFESDARAMLLYIAKTNPQVVIDASNAINNIPEQGNAASDVIVGARDKGWTKIQSIKHVRQITGMRLKESKDFVESLDLQYLFDKNKSW